MKKLLLLFISLSVFTACDNDDAPADGPDPILGVWLLTEVNNPFSDDGELNDCNKQSTIEFMADNTAKTIFYDDSNGPCESTTSTNSWANLGGSKYEMEIPGFGKQEGTVEFNANTSFKFKPSGIPGVYVLFTAQ